MGRSQAVCEQGALCQIFLSCDSVMFLAAVIEARNEGLISRRGSDAHESCGRRGKPWFGVWNIG
jgi:hypothetical protein